MAAEAPTDSVAATRLIAIIMDPIITIEGETLLAAPLQGFNGSPVSPSVMANGDEAETAEGAIPLLAVAGGSHR